MRFNIIRNDYPDSVKMAKNLELIAKKKVNCHLDVKNPEYVFIIGGDGTFLKAVSQYNDQLEKIKFIPIKFGGIGYYTNLNRESEIVDLEHFFNEKYYKEIELPLLAVTTEQKTFYAINEVKIINSSKPINLEILVNNDLLENFKGSGLAFSTGSGSTGYTRSVGGAIIYPNIDLFQMVELAPVSTAIFRTINSPIIFSKQQKITVNNFLDDNKKTVLIIDTVMQKESPKILKLDIADFKLKLISLNSKTQEINKTKFLNEIFVTK